jgi:integrase
MVRGLYISRAPAERLTLAAALDRYLLEETPKKGESTQAAETRKAKSLKAILGKHALAAITPELVARYRDERLATISERTGRNISRDTVRLELALLSHLFTTAIREWGLGLIINPVKLIKKPSPGESRDRRLSPEEEGRLLAVAKEYSNPMAYWIIVLAIETSMRKGEILAIRRPFVNLSRRVIHLPATVTKTKKPRTVPLTKAATKVIKEAMDNPIRPNDTDLVFFGDDPDPKKRSRPYNIDSVWRTIRKRTGLVDFRFHDIRHEGVSQLVESGLSDQHVAAISGHQTMQMLQRYTHLRAGRLVSLLDAAEGEEEDSQEEKA